MAHSLLCFLLFLAIPVFVSSRNPKIVVSKDGSGHYKTISEAVSAIPNSSPVTYTIYIKRGVYNEAVSVGREKNSVVFIGDGAHQTIIRFNKSSSIGIGMDQTATLNVEAASFVAKYISFENSAGVNAGQAVAVRSAGSNDAYYKCSFLGYQDTLFLLYGRKFFYGCNIFGTTDFIFGDGNVIFQNSNIYGRRPGHEGQPVVFTAESRDRPNSDTGIVFQNCTISASPDFGAFNSSSIAFLGRPWREYSRVVVMESFLGDIVNPRGWLAWNTRLDHMAYIEYNNRGPGAVTSGRVDWEGFHAVNKASEVLQFTANKFINASDWLPSIGIPFIPGLIGGDK